jgi:putative methyltransferase (TIGR04325 family)
MATTTKETFFRCKDYQEAQEKTSGYENNNLIEKLVENNKNNPPWKEKSSSLYVTHRQQELCTALMYVICKNKYTDIKISDVGGGNGYLFFSIKKNIPNINWDWTVFESDKVTLAYSQFEQESGIKWRSSKIQIVKYSEVALFSCTLQYLEFPFKMLRKYALKHKYLIITRVPFINEESHVITRQTFPDGGDYQQKNTSWAAWFFSKKQFIAEINKIGDIVYQWETPTEVLMFEGHSVTMEGMLVRVV